MNRADQGTVLQYSFNDRNFFLKFQILAHIFKDFCPKRITFKNII